MLTQEQTDTIVSFVESEHIYFSHLGYDLVDHICCDIENEMLHGYKFSDAYQKVQARIGYKGLKKIQDDTFYLIDKTYRKMKKTMKITGLIAPVLLGFGSLFKVMHWPGSGYLLVLGFFVLCFLFLPTSIYILYKETNSQKSVFVYLSGFLAAVVYSLGVLLKVQHWPGAGVMIASGIFIAVVLFVPSLFVVKLKSVEKSQGRLAMIIGFGALSVFLVGFLCKIMHWPGAAVLMTVGNAILFLVAIPLYAYKLMKSSSLITGKFIFIIVASSWLVITLNLISIKTSTSLSGNYINLYAHLIDNKMSLEKSNEYYVKNDKLINSENYLLLHTSTMELVSFIDKVKTSLFRMDNPKNPYLNESTFKTLKYLKEPYSDGLTSYYMIGEKHDGKAVEIQKKIVSHFDHIATLFPAYKNKTIVNDLLKEIGDKQWVQNNFMNTLYYTVDYLTILQQKILIIESDIQCKGAESNEKSEMLNPQNQES